MTSNGNGKVRNQLTLWLVGALVTVVISFFAIQWQQAESDIGNLHRVIEQIENQHEADVARLDESMRTRRNQIADLEERIAVLEERTRP